MKTHRRKVKRNIRKIFGMLLLICVLTFLFGIRVYASEENTNTQTQEITSGTTPYEIGFSVTGNDDSTNLSSTLQILLLLTVIALAPSILIMVTCFPRILIVLHFVRSALATQTTPPNQILIGLSLFLTVFIMSPVFGDINTQALQPLSREEITIEEAMDRGVQRIREFLIEETDSKDIQLFLDIAKIESVNSLDEIPITTLIPAFITSELGKAFKMGFFIYIPFLVIDMVVASTLMSMGMMMLPPTTISMPFKILLFVMVNGWDLVISAVVKGFL